MNNKRLINRIVWLGLIATLAACDSGPKNYDDCMLVASRTSTKDRQFRMLAEKCREQFPDR